MWLEPLRRFWNRHLDALATEVARGKRERRTKNDTDASTGDEPTGKEGKTDD